MDSFRHGYGMRERILPRSGVRGSLGMFSLQIDHVCKASRRWSNLRSDESALLSPGSFDFFGLPILLRKRRQYHGRAWRGAGRRANGMGSSQPVRLGRGMVLAEPRGYLICAAMAETAAIVTKVGFEPDREPRGVGRLEAVSRVGR